VPNFSAYVAAKGGQKAWTHSMSNELAPFGITVNTVSPGWIPSERHADTRQAELDAYLQAIPVGRWGIPEDIAVAVANFCSPAASFVTGQSLCVNGGRSLS
jgi:3-oxoacyl-[acyl-carrier protein] reductase